MTIDNMRILDIAVADGFAAAFISPAEIPFNPMFRLSCEENICGYYGTNYSCPPDCGSPDEMRQEILSKGKILIVQTIWDIDGYDRSVINNARITHNSKLLHLKNKIESLGYSAFCSGYNGCSLCTPCKSLTGEPCIFPDQQVRCISAYCIDVAKLAEKCNLPFDWSKDKLYLFGMVVL